MKKNVFGIFGLLVTVFVITAIADPNFLSAYNMQNTVKWSSLYGVMSIGVAFVIITGGIDLSIGSVVGLVAVVLSFFTKIQGLDPIVAIGLTLLMSVLIGLIHGLLTRGHIWYSSQKHILNDRFKIFVFWISTKQFQPCFERNRIS